VPQTVKPEAAESPIGCRASNLQFLPSELTTLGLVLWGSARFYHVGAFSALVWIGALLTWTLVVLATKNTARHAEGFLGLARKAAAGGIGLGAIALISKASDGRLTWSRAAAVGVALGVSLALIRWLRSVAIRRENVGLGEGLRWALLQVLAAYAVHPYVHAALIGAGDGYQYSLTMSDFITQVRAGVFPVFVGQSEFALNGSIHTLRTAPYFVHLGALLDALTLRTLPPFALVNLAVIASASLAVLGTYAAMRLYAPTRAAAAMVLSALYILSPAILAPIYAGGMIATFMTAPMIPWWVLGLAMAAEEPDAWRPWIIQGVALAALWWAHPPIALWATALTVGAWVLILARGRGRWSSLERMTAAALLCALLAGYEFASVLTLRLPPSPDLRSTAPEIIFGSIARNWKSSLVPLADHGSMNGSIQLGYALVAAALAGLFAVRSRKSVSIILCCMATLFIFVIPIPGVTARLWSTVPHTVFDLTNAWPMQRLYPLLAALAAFAGLSAAELVAPVGERRAAVAALVVAGALCWSLSEASVLIDRNSDAPPDDEGSARLFWPENVRLTQDSYTFFGFYPSYFSNSPMDPVLETRLIDVKTMEVLADGSTMASGKPPGAFDVVLRENANHDIVPEIPIGPSTASVLRFDFGGSEVDGILQIRGRTLLREYRLPQSGAEKSFGSGAENSRVIAIPNTGTAADSIRMNFLPDSIDNASRVSSRPFAHVSVEPLSAGGHVIEVRSLLPFRAVVQTNRPAVLETPKVYVPGYRARADGRDVEIIRTGAGLVGVPLGAGRSDVTVDYPGSPLLRWSYGISTAGWVMLALCVVVLPVTDPAGEWRRRMFAPRTVLSRGLSVLPAGALVCVLIPVIAFSTSPDPATHREGAMRLVVKLPAMFARKSEPLLTTGRTGAGDVIYVTYLGDDRISVGRDRWGVGGTVSKPFAVDFLAPQVIEVSMGSLAQRAGSKPGPRGVSVKWNGREVLADGRDTFPPGPEEIEIGENLIGASTCVPAFTGEILESHPIEPWKR
jgi:hypothetical protein